jgi:hypothetical protein
VTECDATREDRLDVIRNSSPELERTSGNLRTYRQNFRTRIGKRLVRTAGRQRSLARAVRRAAIETGEDDFPPQGRAVGLFVDRKRLPHLQTPLAYLHALRVRSEGLNWPLYGNTSLASLSVTTAHARGFTTVLWRRGDLGYALVWISIRRISTSSRGRQSDDRPFDDMVAEARAGRSPAVPKTRSQIRFETANREPWSLK